MDNVRPPAPQQIHPQIQQRLPHRGQLNPQIIRPPPIFTSGGDLDLYLKRFDSYARAIGCPEGEKSHMLLALLDDKALTGIARAIANNPQLLYPELIAQLRRAEGYTQNREKHVTELRNRKRLLEENIWDFYLEIHRLAERAYPENDAMKIGSLRESFIANINDPGIAARLRERQDLNLEDLLDLAIMLQGCQSASTTTINSTKEIAATSLLCPEKTLTTINNKLDTLAILMENMALNANKHQTNALYLEGAYTNIEKVINPTDGYTNYEPSDKHHQWEEDQQAPDLY